MLAGVEVEGESERVAEGGVVGEGKGTENVVDAAEAAGCQLILEVGNGEGSEG